MLEQSLPNATILFAFLACCGAAWGNRAFTVWMVLCVLVAGAFWAGGV